MHQPDIYNHFLEIMKQFKAQQYVSALPMPRIRPNGAPRVP